jgi:hypothetical protein
MPGEATSLGHAGEKFLKLWGSSTSSNPSIFLTFFVPTLLFLHPDTEETVSEGAVGKQLIERKFGAMTEK